MYNVNTMVLKQMHLIYTKLHTYADAFEHVKVFLVNEQLVKTLATYPGTSK